MNVDEFINQRSADGKMESEGSFSVDSLAALRKTLSSALPEPHYYLFQILQGLVQAGACDIKVAIGRRENRISFHDPERRFTDLEALAATFDTGLSVASNNPLEQVMSGMPCSLGDHIDLAEFHYDQETVKLTTEGVEHLTSSRPATPQIVLRRHMERGLSFSWSRIWGARKEELRIRKRFEHSPVPLSIAGLPTEPRSSWRRGVEEGHFALLELAVLGKNNHRGEPLVEPKDVEGSSWLLRCGTSHHQPEGSDLVIAPNLFVAGLDGTEPVMAEELEHRWNLRKWTICFTTHTGGPAEIVFVRNGCHLQTHQVDLGISGLRLVAPADDLTVDASGYQVVENDAFEAVVKEAKNLVEKAVEMLKAEDLATALAAGGDDPQEVLSRFDWL